MPGATHGLLGLVEHALAHQEEAALTGPIAVHCRLVSRLLVMVAVVVVAVDPKRVLTSEPDLLPLGFQETLQHHSDTFLCLKFSKYRD